MQIRQLALIAGFSVASIAANAATNEQRTPASFNFNGSDIVSAINRDTLSKVNANIAIYCQTLVSATGESENTQCFDKAGNGQLVTAIEQALSRQSFEPANVKGESVAVRMNYRVIYQQDATSQSSLLVPNLGSLQNELGLDYSEPQEIVAKGWFDKVRDSTGANSPFFAANKQFLRAKANISSTGVATQAAMIDKAAQNQATAIIESITQAEFVPGYINGAPAEMRYLAIISQ